ncbi:MAG: hypothetical protein MUF87_15385, partial [Anaerolineae bacterium]|nr:hypothetical protein [Anaerolineae bacterium]
MPIKATWLAQDRVWYARAYGTLTSNDVKEANIEAAGMIRIGTPPVHFIIDTTGIQNFPINLKDSSDTSMFLREDNLGFTMYVTTNMMIRFITQTITQVAKMDFRVVKTLEEALQLLQILDQTLPPLQMPELKID